MYDTTAIVDYTMHSCFQLPVRPPPIETPMTMYTASATSKLLGGALDALKFRCAQRDSSQSFSCRRTCLITSESQRTRATHQNAS